MRDKMESVPRRKPGSEQGDEHWLESLELAGGRRAVDAGDLEGLRELDDDEGPFEAEPEEFEDGTDDDEDLQR
ncbi:MAG: hypothetical protein HZB25_03120 [Candidatus Eisenbacteria bacterium]|nr:hypothetical protein [Candidatus Eisenbacteria bacterium]